MINEMQELKDIFKEVFNISKGGGLYPARDFLIAFCYCLRFISDTPNFDTKVRRMLIKRKLNDTFSAIRKLYELLDNQGDIKKDIEIIWSKMPARFTDYQAARSAARSFYEELIRTLERVDIDNPFNKVSILINKKASTICLCEDKEKGYKIIKRAKNKSKPPQRFQIILLLKVHGSMSAKRICENLGFEKPTKDKIKNTKDEIEEINKNFRKKVFNDDLIIKNKQRNKYIYLLNKKSFHFYNEK